MGALWGGTRINVCVCVCVCVRARTLGDEMASQGN